MLMHMNPMTSWCAVILPSASTSLSLNEVHVRIRPQWSSMQQSSSNNLEPELLIPSIPCDSVANFCSQGTSLEFALNDFWNALRPWLRTQGVELYDLGHPHYERPNTVAPKVWVTPLESTAGPLPYARCKGKRVEKPRFFSVPIRFGLHVHKIVAAGT
ncbi:hypothetical protein C8Q74DRAFT_750112 [Fomes fomentarius]|nr:hypothetical protein C8Q74DRAFT_750112 [Fomes fomentarius]